MMSVADKEGDRVARNQTGKERWLFGTDGKSKKVMGGKIVEPMGFGL